MSTNCNIFIVFEAPSLKHWVRFAKAGCSNESSWCRRVNLAESTEQFPLFNRCTRLNQAKRIFTAIQLNALRWHLKEALCLSSYRVCYIYSWTDYKSGRIRDSLLVRAPDSWLKGPEFESQQKRQENFLLQSQLCVLTLIRCLFHPRVIAVACKIPQSFCQKCRWQVTPKHAYTLALPNEVGVGWLHRWAGIVWEPIRKQAHPQLVRKRLTMVISAHWATVYWSWHEEWN